MLFLVILFYRLDFKFMYFAITIFLFPDVPDDGPVIRTDMQKVAPGAKIKANCTIPAAYPRMNITWSVNDEVSNFLMFYMAVSLGFFLIVLVSFCINLPHMKYLFR